MDLKAFFDNQACNWDEEQAAFRPPVEKLLNALQLAPGEDVLEIGCGSGWLLESLGRRIAPGQLFALDFSSKMLRKAAVRRFEFPLVIIHSGAEDIPLPDRSMDRVILINTFSQFQSPELVIAEVSRILKRGGRLDIKYFFSREEINAHHSQIKPLQGMGIPEDHILFRRFRSAGFVSSVVERKNGFHITSRLVA
jgi:SAM-dependent methyltransferase